MHTLFLKILWFHWIVHNFHISFDLAQNNKSHLQTQHGHPSWVSLSANSWLGASFLAILPISSHRQRRLCHSLAGRWSRRTYYPPTKTTNYILLTYRARLGFPHFWFWMSFDYPAVLPILALGAIFPIFITPKTLVSLTMIPYRLCDVWLLSLPCECIFKVIACMYVCNCKH